MSKSKTRYGLGLIYVSLFFINSFIITYLITLSVNIYINVLTIEDIISLLIDNQQTQIINVMYYSLIYKMMFAVYLFEAVMIAIIFRKKLSNKVKQFKTNFKSHILKIGSYVTVMIGLIIFVYIILFLTGTDITAVGDNQSMINTVLLNNPNVYILLTVIILAPIIEEFIFRYGLINHLLNKFNPYVQIIIGSLIFTFIHIGLSQLLLSPITALHLILMYLPMSVIYNYVYIREKNIIYPLALHMINNIGSIIFVFVVSQL
ncbi:type II CAAX endopeptidase family protein [Mollicutes bacterium LVI A0078]|nr:type II CAAX endopeptidase family protein [Mollicutes bacterium LVI A0075]WOO91192.1 type II CAAX endopeptidase family protein [Mollicutes bacterium LVI A0078]